MKKIVLFAASLLFLFQVSIAQEANVQKKDPVGKWKFEAPYAPEGYQSGTMIFGVTEGKYNAGTVFTNFDYKFPGEQVKYARDSITFVVNLEGQAIKILLKLEDTQKMTGKAVYSEGSIPLSLTRQTENK